MSTITPPPAIYAPSKGAVSDRPSAAEKLIESRIAEAAASLWWAELTRRILGLIIALVAGLLIWLIFDHWISSPGMVVRSAALLSALIAAGTYLYLRVLPMIGSQIRPEYAARSLERDLPELRHSLTSYVTLSKDPQMVGLQGRVVRSIGASTASRLKSHNDLPAEAAGTMVWWIATAVALSTLIAYAVISPKNSLQSAGRLIAPLAGIDSPRRVSIADVAPGDVDAIAGRDVPVSASIAGLVDDEEAVCQWELPAGSRRIVLARDVDGGPRRFVGSLPLPHSASGQVAYRIIAGDAQAGPFVLTVRDIPVVSVQSILHQPPPYTGRPEHTSSNAAITAIDGTGITLRAQSNRAVKRAVIEFNPRPLGDTVRATAGATEMKIAEDGTSLSIDFRIKGSRGRSAAVELDSYRIVAWDESNQTNFDPIIYPIRVISDLPPEISIVMPTQSPKNVPINAQQVIEVHASDPDFGLSEIRLEIRSGMDLIDEPLLWHQTKTESNATASNETGNRITEYRFRPGTMAARGARLRVGDTVQIIAVAVDNRVVANDPTVEPNVSRTDPIELKLVASDELPPAGQPESEGMSAPDDRPPSDAQEQQEQGESSEKSSGDGKPQSGGGGSGSGEAKQQPGQGQSGGGKSGQGQDNSESSNDDTSGQNPSGGGESGDRDSGSDPKDGTDSDGDQRGEPNPAQSGENSSGASNGNSPMQPEQGSQDPSKEQSGDQSSNGSSTPQDAKENSSSGGQSGGADQKGSSKAGSSKGDGLQGENAQGGASSDQNSSEQADNAGGGAKDSSNDGGGNESSAPQHDGEAFERIKDYLDKKQQGEPGNSGESQMQNEKGQVKPNGDSGQSRSNPENASTDQRSGEKGSGEKGSGESSSTHDDSSQQSDAPEGSPKPGQKGKGTAENSAEGDSDPDQGEPSDGTPGADDGRSSQESSDGKAGEAMQGDGKHGDAKSKDGKTDNSNQQDGKPSDAKTGETKPSDAKPSDSKSSDGKSGNGKPGEPKPGDGSEPGIGYGADGNGKGGDAAMPPDAVNTDYAKKATDMVLDYLDQTRDQPDQELLDKLKWTREDLQRFRDRWKDVRDLDPTSASETPRNRDIEDALRSLGMRAPGSDTGDTRSDTADDLRGIRDSGNRKPPPAAYRDAFDAFRRAMGAPK